MITPAEARTAARMRLSACVRHVLAAGLRLLGVAPLEEMSSRAPFFTAKAPRNAKRRSGLEVSSYKSAAAAPEEKAPREARRSRGAWHGGTEGVVVAWR